MGCKGGYEFRALEYVIRAGGLMQEKDYPYTATDSGPCKFNNGKIAASISNYYRIQPNEDSYAANLLKCGPLSGNTKSNFTH